MSRPPVSARLCALVFLCALAPALHAQIEVHMDIPRHLYLSYEPIVATVSITNNTGRDLTLEDKAPDHWFTFEIMNNDGTPIPARADEQNLQPSTDPASGAIASSTTAIFSERPPLTIPMGETVKRKVNLVNLYPISDYGVYHVRAVIYFDAMDKYFASRGVGFEVSEGKTLWQKTVGIPDGQQNAGQMREFELVSFQQPKDNMLYVRIQDHDAGIVYATYPIGSIISGYDPQAEVDALSQLHVLLMAAPKEYLYTRLGPNGEMLGQDDYTDLKTRPHLRRMENGDVLIAGGIQVLPKTASQAADNGPKLSDRPAGMPGQ
jgi:hypothetical protein